MEKQFNPTNIKIHQVFPTVKVLEFKISHDPKDVVQKLNPYILDDLPTHDLIVASDRVRTSISGEVRTSKGSVGTSSYMTLDYILDKKEFLSLKEEILCCVEEYNKRYRVHKQDIKLENSWFNVMTKGTQLSFHIHNGSLLTGGYYPFLPAGSADLVIIDPETIRSLITSGKSVRHLQELSRSKDDNREKRSIPIKEGYLYVFPSWLEHGTLNNNCDKRIVISFNTNFLNAGKSGNMHQKEFVGEELEKYLEGVGKGKTLKFQQFFGHYLPTSAKVIPTIDEVSLIQSNSLYYES